MREKMRYGMGMNYYDIRQEKTVTYNLGSEWWC